MPVKTVLRNLRVNCFIIESMLELLKRKEEQRLHRREELRMEVRRKLRQALGELAPGEKVFIFGSLTLAYAFHERSDVDIAFAEEPKKLSRYMLQSKLEERIGRPVDLIVLAECRFRRKIEREGELWTS